MLLKPTELQYVSEPKLGRLATIDENGMPHVVPLGWRYDPQHDVVEVSGRNTSKTRKFHHVQRNANVALVIDDVLPPWRPRGVMIRGLAEAIEIGQSEGIIRIHPAQVISWGLED